MEINDPVYLTVNRMPYICTQAKPFRAIYSIPYPLAISKLSYGCSQFLVKIPQTRHPVYTKRFSNYNKKSLQNLPPSLILSKNTAFAILCIALNLYKIV